MNVMRRKSKETGPARSEAARNSSPNTGGVNLNFKNSAASSFFKNQFTS